MARRKKSESHMNIKSKWISSPKISSHKDNTRSILFTGEFNRYLNLKKFQSYTSFPENRVMGTTQVILCGLICLISGSYKKGNPCPNSLMKIDANIPAKAWTIRIHNVKKMVKLNWLLCFYHRSSMFVQYQKISVSNWQYWLIKGEGKKQLSQ